MKISVAVKTGAREERIEEILPSEYRVSVRERPIAGKANAAVVRALAAYFAVPQSAVSIRTGHTGRRKIIEIHTSP
ncbi:MAG: hypothetical protein A3B37_02380 [Candidatus Sungbacteria bacterium RIFCSPLOWO2_01_FULL_59_16]|uniref:UPF0235 protein A3B37_02380 n=1 Tax=Candidatus Sungbacteria bacterium RIFCSPLOWO2_01_FULL_59_16 TaxID=1802280 RepID=A0A1G2LCM1_9BACT|nr:MAG: hypothetical protein A3B37_02380 [Candidatus Sungbacteria bacterium RIFCSPLOWO2_01_FULL_59_16]